MNNLWGTRSCSIPWKRDQPKLSNQEQFGVRKEKTRRNSRYSTGKLSFNAWESGMLIFFSFLFFFYIQREFLLSKRTKILWRLIEIQKTSHDIDGNSRIIAFPDLSNLFENKVGAGFMGTRLGFKGQILSIFFLFLSETEGPNEPNGWAK